jgi:predicted transcriptional regulator
MPFASFNIVASYFMFYGDKYFFPHILMSYLVNSLTIVISFKDCIIKNKDYFSFKRKNFNASNMSEEVLEKLFHSKAKVRLLRLFLNNPDKAYLISEAAKELKINTASARKEINNLTKAGFLLLRKKSKKSYYQVNRNFVFYEELRRLIFKTNPTSFSKIKSQVTKLGQVRFVLVSGALINSEKGRVDIMIVGENIDRSKLRGFLSGVEAEAGKKINYVYLTTDEFKYRKDMFDKFIADIFDGPHKILINKLKMDI